MPLNSSKRNRSNTRTAAHAVLLAALALLAASALFGVGASAQRAKNDNTAQQQGRSSRRVIVGRGSETSSGSRTTITADDSLNDYSAYRSGDRFVVVLPKSAAGAVAKGSGKGYSDVQVQQRGDSVVVSYKVQPGAKPRVEQKFNRLDVVFDVKDGAQPTASGQQTATQQPAENRNPNATAQQQQQQQQPRTSETPANPNDRRANEAASNTTQTGASTPANNAAQTGQPSTQTEVAQTQSTPAAVEQTPSTAPTAEPQIAQSQQPAPIAPITKTDNPAANAQAGVSFGAMLARNWPIPLFVALLVIGLGLVFFTRRSAGNAPEAATVETATTTTKKKLEEPRAVSLKEAKAEPIAVADVVATKPAPVVEAKPEPVAEVKPLVAPVVVPADKSDRRKKKKQRKGKVRGGRVEELPLDDSNAVEETSLESLVAASPAEVSEPSAEVVETPVEEPTVEVAAPSVEETLVAEPEHIEAPAPETEVTAAETHAFVSTPTVEDVAEVEAPRETSLEPSVEPEVAAVEASTVEPVIESAVEPVSESAAPTVTSIAPASAPDPEDVQVATRRLLEGQSYERSVIGSEDSMARQLIGAELLSALAGRNAERRERARAAFVEHGYFDEKARDVRAAAAPAERAAAARSLAIVGERSAAPHLISALEDDSMEVRRAAVEALGALREPTAVEPLEALLQREKSQRNRIPNRIIQHAIETCRLAAAEELMPRVEETAHAEEVSAHEPEVEAAPVEEVATRETAIAPALEEEAPEVEEATLLSEPTPTVEVETRPSVEPTLFETQPSVEELQPETQTAVEAQVDAEIAPVAEFQPVEEPWLIEETQPVEEAQAVEEPSHAGEVPALEESGLELLPESAPPPVAESNTVEPFFNAPQTFEPPVAEPQASEWFEFDVNDIGSAEQAPPASPSEPVFELSSGETMQAEPVAEAETQTLEVEPPAPEAFESTQAFEPSVVEETTQVSQVEFEGGDVAEPAVETAVEPTAGEAVTAPLPDVHEKGVMPFDEHSIVPATIQQRLTSRESSVRAAAITELSHLDTDEAFQQICSAFDDESKEVRSAAARALYELRTDRAESFTRALREANPDRRRNIGAAVSTSGLASEAISQLTGESRDRTYEAFSLLFLMAKAGEVQPLVRAIEGHPNNEVRLAVVKLLALSGQKEILPAFRRLAVRGSLPTEVRSAVMEAIYQISSSQPTTV